MNQKTNIFDEQLAKWGAYADTSEAFYQSITKRLAAEALAKDMRAALTIEQRVRLEIILKMLDSPNSHFAHNSAQTHKAVEMLALIVLKAPPTGT